ncbi:MAG: hypothetical protein DCF16_15170 [Alphaproteobacteria bacterium]|nr:MAG: hypothetical protein DCF16_15170 [Alphaproteobacteria bacterium]
MAIFVVIYDYGTGATFFGIEARSEAEIIETLSDVTVIAEPEKHPHMTAGILQRVRAGPRELSDPVFDAIRKASRNV